MIPAAVYLFMESVEGYAGKRLYVTKTKEEENSPLIEKIQRGERCPADEEYQKQNRFLVYFMIDKTIPLIGEASPLTVG
jgi:hypothetical protein